MFDDQHSGASRIFAFPGILAGLVAVALGWIFLIFALPSLGRPGELDWLFSQAAGGLLIVFLGLEGILAAILAWTGKRDVRLLRVLESLIAALFFAVLAINREWAASITLIIIAFVVAAILFRCKNAAGLLHLFIGISGFLISQAAITLLPYGWKAWSIPGVLFIYSGICLSIPDAFRRVLVYLGKGSQRRGRTLFAFISLAAMLLAVSAMIHLPGPAGPGIVNTPDDAGSGTKSIAKATVSEDTRGCNCTRNSASALSASALQRRPSENDSVSHSNSMILSPGDARTFPYGQPVSFSAADCRSGSCRYLWKSSSDGILGENQSFETRNLSLGWHNITLTVSSMGANNTDEYNVNANNISENNSSSRAIETPMRPGRGSQETDEKQNLSTLKFIFPWEISETYYVEIGIAEPWVCGNVNPRPKYYPLDTPCRDIWPNAPRNCQELEVCHPDLDWIVAESVDCCDGTPLPGSACANACNQSNGDRKRCRGLFIINAFGPEARYMKGYAIFKACCSGYPECSRMCSQSLQGTCSFRDGFNANVSNLSCRPDEQDVIAWHSDTNMSENSAVMGLLPTHATVNILQTGVCIDYAAAVTTMLRKAGYNKSEAFSTSSTGYDLPIVGKHPGHAYNLVLLPGDSHYHIVDTTGNGDGINLDGVPGYFRFTGCFLSMPSQISVMDWWVGYCNKTASVSYNDAGYFATPEKKEICGCS
jgi:hypothetical protein